MELNLNNISTTESGNVRFSGISSGIDSQSLIDSLLEAKRIPAVQIEAKITQNNDRLTAIADLKALTTDFAERLDVLRGSTSFFADDVFKTKQAFTNDRDSALAPPGHVRSAAGDILGVSITDGAVKGQRVVEVLNIAKAQQIRSDAFTDTNTDLTTLGVSAGSFDVNGKTINIAAGDTLLDLRDKINATNTGETPSNVSASIVSVSATENYLVMTSTETGTTNDITFTGAQAVHNSIGLTTVGTNNVKTELQAAEDAIFRADNLGVDITRQSNTIDDLYQGVTLDLFKAEEFTEIVIDIEDDLNSVKTAIIDFVDSYNAIREFMTDQKTESIRTEGGDPEFGALNNEGLLRQIDQRLGSLVASIVPGTENGFQSLGQVGININDDFLLEMDESVFDNKLLTNMDGIRKLFTFDAYSSDSRVSVIGHDGNLTYTVDGAGDAEPYYLNIAGTDAGGVITDANLQTAAGGGTLGDGSITRAGNVMTVTDLSPANGLKFSFNGGASLGPVNDIEVTFTRGVADQLYSFFDNVSKSAGLLDELSTNVALEIEGQQDRVEQIDLRLDIERRTLSAKYLAMETALFQFNALREQLQKQADALNAGS